MKKLLVLLALMAALGVWASGALAHNGTIDATCTSVTFHYANFPAGANSAAYSINVSSGSGSQSGTNSWSGTSADISRAINATGNAVVTVNTSWTADEGGQARRSVSLQCRSETTTTSTVCADGRPPDAGKDGQPGNDACNHTTTTTPTTTASVTTTSPTTTQSTSTTTPTTPTTSTTETPKTTLPSKPKKNEQLTPVVDRTSVPGQLPNTGISLWYVVIAALVLISAGLYLRRRA